MTLDLLLNITFSEGTFSGDYQDTKSSAMYCHELIDVIVQTTGENEWLSIELYNNKMTPADSSSLLVCLSNPKLSQTNTKLTLQNWHTQDMLDPIAVKALYNTILPSVSVIEAN